MRRQTVKIERFVDESSVEAYQGHPSGKEDMNFSLEESNYLKLIKCSN
ncbi:Uncharacterised protein [uncultured archaeon]|nr:Uncharacterised protein [uncultured archaeon]